jgi:hypothetical protein
MAEFGQIFYDYAVGPVTFVVKFHSCETLIGFTSPLSFGSVLSLKV